jgi:DNA-binding beta-propeller fold protein YncE
MRSLRSPRLVAVAALLVGAGAGLIAASGGDREPVSVVARVPGQPVRLATGSGRVWVATQGPGAVWVLDAASGHPRGAPLRTRALPGPLAVGAAGAWVGEVSGAKLVPLRLAPLRRFPSIAVGSDVSDVALAARAVWVASSAEGVIRVLEPGGKPPRSLRVGGRPVALAADERRVVVVDAGTGSLAWIDARTRRIAGYGLRVGGAPVDAALAGDTVWVADARGARLLRVDLRTRAVAAGGVAVGRRPIAVATADDDVYALSAGDHSLVRVDGRTGEVRSRATVGPAPSALAVDAGHVWVADTQTRTVTGYPR